MDIPFHGFHVDHSQRDSADNPLDAGSCIVLAYDGQVDEEPGPLQGCRRSGNPGIPAPPSDSQTASGAMTERLFKTAWKKVEEGLKKSHKGICQSGSPTCSGQ